MYKITFIVVAIFVFAFQGANSTPVENQDGGSAAAGEIKLSAGEDGNTDTTPSTTTNGPSTTPKATGGASGVEICTLLLQVSSLAMVAKHVML